MSWKRMVVGTFSVIMALNILQINVFLITLYDAQITSGEPGSKFISDMITTIWYGEIFIGLILSVVLVLSYRSMKKRKEESSLNKIETPKGKMSITSTIGYNPPYIFYEVKVGNKTDFNISDVTTRAYLSNDIFTLDDNIKIIPLVKARGSETVEFNIMPKSGNQGKAHVLVRINYYNPDIDDYEEQLSTPMAIRLLWPVLHSGKIGEEEWERIINTLHTSERTIQDIPITGERCNEFGLGIMQGKDFNIISSKVMEEDVYTTTTWLYALEKDGSKCATKVTVSAKTRDKPPSQLKIEFFAESRETLIGLYYLILNDLNKVLEILVKRKVLDIKVGEEQVRKKLDKMHIEELRRFEEAYNLLCEAETSGTILPKEDFPDSAKKAILLVYFNAVEVYVRGRMKELIPKGVTILLGEDRGHINTRKKDWEKTWASLSLGNCTHIIDINRYIFLKNEKLWDEEVKMLMHQVRELRNTVAHPSKKNPDPKLVREKVYALFSLFPEVLKSTIE